MTRRTLALAATLPALAFAVSACGSSNQETSASASNPAPTATVSVKPVSGMGDVLVDAQGNALYTPVQEATGKIKCTAGCTSIWPPLEPGTGKPTSGQGVSGKLAVIMRPDGTRQVTLGGKPLYTFTQDPGPGQVTGNGVKDSFGSTSFTWHVATAGAAPKAAATATPAQSQRSGY